MITSTCMGKIQYLIDILEYTIYYYSILYTIKYDTILYYTLLYYTILYCTTLYFTLLSSTLLYNSILYYTKLYYIILYYTIHYSTILYDTIRYYTILYYTILIVSIIVYIYLYLKLLLTYTYANTKTNTNTNTNTNTGTNTHTNTILIYTHEALLKCLKMFQAQPEQKSPLPFWRGKPGTQGLVDWSHVTQLFSTDSSIDGLRIATWCSVTFMFFPRSNYIHSILALCIFQLCLSPGQIRSTAPVEEGDSKVTRGRSRAGKPTGFRDDTVRKSIQIGLFLKVFEMLCWIKNCVKMGCNYTTYMDMNGAKDTRCSRTDTWISMNFHWQCSFHVPWRRRSEASKRIWRLDRVGRALPLESKAIQSHCSDCSDHIKLTGHWQGLGVRM